MNQNLDYSSKENAENKITRLYNILSTFRNIHKIIVQEKSIDNLISSFCTELIISGCYTASWIMLLDKNKQTSKMAQHGFSNEFSTLIKQFRKNEYNVCSSRALLSPGVVQINASKTLCKNCPLYGKLPSHQAFTIRIEYENQIFGLLSVEIPKSISLAEEEAELFAEISQNLGFALHTISMEKEAEEQRIFLNAMSATAMFFLDESKPEKLYDYIANQLLTLTANNAYVIVASVDKAESYITVQSISGLNKIIQKAADVLGEGPVGIKIPLTLSPTSDLRTGKLHRFDGGLYELFQGSRSKLICSTLTKLAKIGSIYQIGLTRDNHLFGNITFLHKDNNTVAPNPTTTEAFAKQTSIAIHKNLVEKELQKMEKLQSVGLLAGGIAHDFNNILTGVYGNISLAMNTLTKKNREYQYLKKANNSMNRAIRLTKQLLTFAKGGEPIKESIRISSLIRNVVKFDLSGSSILPIFRKDNNLWTTDADKGQIQQVFSNLTVNARHAMPEGGHIFVNLTNEAITNHTVLTEGNYIKITFKDEGTGIKSENLDRIFEPYFSTKASGSGLGLSTVYSVIAKHDGFVEVSSEKNKGTNFTIFLPASDKMEAREPEQGTTASKGIRKEKHRILVMDDEQVICELLTEMLHILGYGSDFANEGNETIKKYKKSLQTNNPYDIVIMDLTIPGGKGGLETVKEILQINPNAKVIVSSGYGHGKIMSNYKEYGFIDIAPKPYTMDKLEEILHRVL